MAGAVLGAGAVAVLQGRDDGGRVVTAVARGELTSRVTGIELP